MNQEFVYTQYKNAEPHAFSYWKNCQTLHQWASGILQKQLEEDQLYELTSSMIRDLERDLKSGKLEKIRQMYDTHISAKTLYKNCLTLIRQARRLFDANFHIYYVYRKTKS